MSTRQESGADMGNAKEGAVLNRQVIVVSGKKNRRGRKSTAGQAQLDPNYHSVVVVDPSPSQGNWGPGSDDIDLAVQVGSGSTSRPPDPPPSLNINTGSNREQTLPFSSNNIDSLIPLNEAVTSMMQGLSDAMESDEMVEETPSSALGLETIQENANA